MVKVIEIEEVLIDAVRRSQRELINKYSIGFREERDRDLLKKMFEKKQYDGITGEKINGVY